MEIYATFRAEKVRLVPQGLKFETPSFNGRQYADYCDCIFSFRSCSPFSVRQ